MHDLKLIVEQPELYTDMAERRGATDVDVNHVIELDSKRKKLIGIAEENRSQVKSLSKKIGPMKKSGEDTTELMSEVAEAKRLIQDSEEKLQSVNDEIIHIISRWPNLLDEVVPNGTSDEDNQLIHDWGTKRDFEFEPADHHTLGESLGMLDFERGARLTGSRNVVYRGQLAQLERALINFFLDEHNSIGYEEIIPPYIVNRETMYGTGNLPKFEEDLFKIQDDRDWFLIPTAEVPLTNLKKQELFDGKELPYKFTAFTPCFRSEAGSYGKDTRGLMRLHQFNKVEMVNIVAADKSTEAHEAMIRQAELMLEKLNLPYRRMLLCSGDIGFGARKCYDLEVWIPSQQKYREISSVSNCWDFQARRANIRYRNSEGKPQFAHTLNGSGLAVGRTVLAIMENYQNEDGSITIPEILRPYMRNQEKICKN